MNRYARRFTLYCRSICYRAVPYGRLVVVTRTPGNAADTVIVEGMQPFLSTMTDAARCTRYASYKRAWCDCRWRPFGPAARTGVSKKTFNLSTCTHVRAVCAYSVVAPRAYRIRMPRFDALTPRFLLSSSAHPPPLQVSHIFLLGEPTKARSVSRRECADGCPNKVRRHVYTRGYHDPTGPVSYLTENVCTSAPHRPPSPIECANTNASLLDCAVCSSGYGRGVANACHLCTATFKGWMYFVLAVATLITIVVAVLLAVFLVRLSLKNVCSVEKAQS